MKLRGHTDQARGNPSSRCGNVCAETFVHQQAKIGPVLIKLVGVEQPLADQVCREGVLVLDDDRCAPSIDPPGVDPSLRPRTDRILRCQEPDVEQRTEMALHEALQRSFDCVGAAGEFDNGVSTAAEAEQPGRVALACPATGTGLVGGSWIHSRRHHCSSQAPSLIGILSRSLRVFRARVPLPLPTDRHSVQGSTMKSP